MRKMAVQKGGGAVRIPTLPIPTVLSSYSRIAGLGWEPGYSVSYVSREARKSRNYFPNMHSVYKQEICEKKYSEYAQICANNERQYAEICGKYWHRQPVLIVSVQSYKTGTVEQQ